MVDPLRYSSFQPVLHDWCNNGRGICYSVCGMMHMNGRKEMFYLTTHFKFKVIWHWTYGKGPLSKRGNPLPPAERVAHVAAAGFLSC